MDEGRKGWLDREQVWRIYVHCKFPLAAETVKKVILPQSFSHETDLDLLRNQMRKELSPTNQ